MPGIFHEPITRKQFLTTAKAVAALGITSAIRADAQDDASNHGIKLALLSDTHIPADINNSYRGFRPVENLKQVVPEVVRSRPEMTIIDGDAARLTGQAEDYSVLKSLLRPIAQQAPVHLGLGNHDDRSNFFKVFPANPDGASPVESKHVSVIEKSGVRFVILDSLLYVDKVAGLLGKAQRTWLEMMLQREPPMPTVFFVHHTLGDGDGDLLDAGRMFRILAEHKHVKAVFYGHSHRYSFEKRDQIHLINLPAVGYNFVDDQPVGWIEADFSNSGVDLVLHAIGGNTDSNGQKTSLSWS